MATKKRGAERQITKDDGDAEEVADKGHFQTASAERIEKREIVTVKRKMPREESSTTFPKIDLLLKPTPSPNPLDKFRLQSDQWECQTCFVTNDHTEQKCKSCETPNPSASEEKKPAATKKPKTEEPAFTFGSPDHKSEEVTFGAPTTGTAGALGFNWSDASTGGFTFGSSSTDGNVTFSSLDSTSSDFSASGDIKFEGNDTQSLNSAPSEHAELFKGKVAEKSGEEGDSVRHTVTVKLYQQKQVPKKAAGVTTEGGEESTPADSKEMELRYVEAGSGELHVNAITKDSAVVSGRLVLRMDKTQRLLLNAAILPAVTKPVTEDKWVRFASMGEGGKLEHYGLKMRTKEEASGLAREIHEIIKSLLKK